MDTDRRSASIPNAHSCGRGNPIYPLVGVKRESVDSGVHLRFAKAELVYDSARAPWTSNGQMMVSGALNVAGDLGRLWWIGVRRQVYVNANSQSMRVVRGDGSAVDLVLSGGQWKTQTDQRSSAVEHQDAMTARVGGGWHYRDQSGLSLESYDSAGLMSGWVQATGMALTPSISAGNLSRLSDPFGRSIAFTYSTLTPSGDTLVAINTITDALGQTITAGYDSDANLTSLTWQDGLVRTFVYDSPKASQRWALTGVKDEVGNRYATFGYDVGGRAISTEHAGGTNRYTVSYSGDGPQVVTTEAYDAAANVIHRYLDWSVPSAPVVTGPNGVEESFNAPDVSLKYPRDTGRSQPAGSGCSASSSKMEYDSNGNRALEDDFNGHRTCYASTSATEGVSNLEKIRVEGLVGSTGANASATPTQCASVVSDGASLPSGSRKVSTQWHPQWALKIKEARPKLLTTWVYNGQPDPFNGNQVASCASAKYGASAVAPLPDGNAIAVLCKKVEQATLDTDGSKGFSATLSSAGGINQRTWSYSYNQYGQVLTSTDPLGHTTTYEYHCQDNSTCDGTNKYAFTGTAPNEVGHYQGDLWKVTNPAGHVTEYTSYDRAGRVLKVRDANGLETAYSYTPRGWIKSVNVGGLLTQYDYWPTGLLKKATQPDGSYLYYQYDDAQRLTDISDQVDADGKLTGNTVHYELDNMGNRKQESVKDASGTLARSISRTYDALNRLQTIQGALQ